MAAMVMDMDGPDLLGAPAPKPLVEGLRPSNSPLPCAADAAWEGFETGLFKGHVAAPCASEFWLNLDDKTRRVMLWDVPMDLRAMALQDCWFKADYVGLAWTGNKVSPSMACWLAAPGPGSRCAMIHFCFARQARPLALQIGFEMLNRIANETGLKSLVGLLPATYRHAINFVKRLGFCHAATLAGACPMDGRGTVDGVLVTMNPEGAECIPKTISPDPTRPEPRTGAISSAMTWRPSSAAPKVFA